MRKQNGEIDTEETLRRPFTTAIQKGDSRMVLCLQLTGNTDAFGTAFLRTYTLHLSNLVMHGIQFLA